MTTRIFSEAVLPRRFVSDGQFLDPNDPAIHAVTDFTREHPVTVGEERQIDDALGDMIHLGVRAMLVMREQRIVGMITSYDIQGERPLQFLQTSNYSRHQDICVGHIMTAWDKLLALDWESIQAARAGDLLQALEEAGLTHLLVIESGAKNAAPIVRAMVSRARLARQLRGQAAPASVLNQKFTAHRERHRSPSPRRGDS
jgi:CBS-domain-containing membrane protein